MRVKVRYTGEEPFKHDTTWVYQGSDMRLDPDIIKMLWSKYGKENFTTLRDPRGLLGEVVKPTPGDGVVLEKGKSKGKAKAAKE